MLFMNEYDIEQALLRFAQAETPNLLTGAFVVARLAVWANHNSDGWCYWPKPCRAAARLQGHLTKADRFDPVDITDAELAAAVRPIKAFLTRQDVDAATRSEITQPNIHTTA